MTSFSAFPCRSVPARVSLAHHLSPRCLPARVLPSFLAFTAGSLHAVLHSTGAALTAVVCPLEYEIWTVCRLLSLPPVLGWY